MAKESGKGLHQLLLEKAMDAGLRPWMGTNGAYVDVDGETWDIADPRVRFWLHNFYKSGCGLMLKKEPLDEAMHALKALAWSNAAAVTVYDRVARPEWGRIVIDRGVSEDQSAGRYVVISADGWRLEDGVPERFVVRPGARALPVPAVGLGTLPELLRPFLPGCRPEDVAIIVAWLVAALQGEMSDGEFPILLITGESGSAKSTITKFLRRLIDPHAVESREPTSDPRDLAAMVRNSYILAMDNVSRLTLEMSDRLCTLSVGGRGLGGRRLYTDYDDAGFSALRPIILNGIHNFVEQGDLADRALSVHLASVPDVERRDIAAVARDFEAAVPAILGALYDCVAAALKNFDTVELGPLPRLALFTRWACAAEKATSFEEGTIYAAIRANRREAAENLVERDTVAAALLDLLAEREYFCGTAVELRDQLAPYRRLGDDRWPQGTSAFIAHMGRIKPALRQLGVSVSNQGRRREGGAGRTLIEVRRGVSAA